LRLLFPFQYGIEASKRYFRSGGFKAAGLVELFKLSVKTVLEANSVKGAGSAERLGDFLTAKQRYTKSEETLLR
jgi:hypothetical protein